MIGDNWEEAAKPAASSYDLWYLDRLHKISCLKHKKSLQNIVGICLHLQKKYDIILTIFALFTANER